MGSQVKNWFGNHLIRRIWILLIQINSSCGEDSFKSFDFVKSVMLNFHVRGLRDLKAASDLGTRLMTGLLKGWEVQLNKNIVLFSLEAQMLRVIIAHITVRCATIHSGGFRCHIKAQVCVLLCTIGDAHQRFHCAYLYLSFHKIRKWLPPNSAGLQMGDDSYSAEWGGSRLCPPPLPARESPHPAPTYAACWKIASGRTTREINDFLDKGSRQSRKHFSWG